MAKAKFSYVYRRKAGHQVPPSFSFSCARLYGIPGAAAERTSATATLPFLSFRVCRLLFPVCLLATCVSSLHVFELSSRNRLASSSSRRHLSSSPCPNTLAAPLLLYSHTTGPPYCDAQLGHHPGGNCRNVNVSVRTRLPRSSVYWCKQYRYRYI